jgi:hypothetical protein
LFAVFVEVLTPMDSISLASCCIDAFCNYAVIPDVIFVVGE